MTHEQEIDLIQARLAALAELTADVTGDIGRQLEFLKQPQEQKMTRDEAIDKAMAEVESLSQGLRYLQFFTTRTGVTICTWGDAGNLGRARCANGDRFSTPVGQAIALYRALGREVPEWLLHIPQE